MRTHQNPQFHVPSLFMGKGNMCFASRLLWKNLRQNQSSDILGLHGSVDMTRIYGNITKKSTRCRAKFSLNQCKFSPRRLCR
ncbi:hypothetical protein EUGRSUZ_C03072 [Eucalyptus grandis]|uniref:Uncharacterized protein n=2 Tax=Eucalyptus grandis TaxID=71139 RepID=A0ACC3LJM0_EUCGR|nr:hypothetical protein EUGRSUZ_C03072 [Eucalyptus grandis]